MIVQEFIIKPNNSLSRHQLLMLGSTFALALMIFAVRLLVMGMWLVVPFLLVDFAAVAIAFYIIRKKCRIHESINIDKARLHIHHHELKRCKSWSFDLRWVKVKLQEHAHPWQPSRLLVGSHGKWIEFAAFLTDDERAELSGALKRTIQMKKQYAW